MISHQLRGPDLHCNLATWFGLAMPSAMSTAVTNKKNIKARIPDNLQKKAISYAVGFVSRKRPFSTEAQIGFSYAVEKELFRLRIPTGGSSRKKERSSRKTQSNKFYTCFLNRSHRPSHHQTDTNTATRPHTHTRYHTSVFYKALTQPWLSLLLLLAASQRGAFLVPLASSVYQPPRWRIRLSSSLV